MTPLLPAFTPARFADVAQARDRVYCCSARQLLCALPDKSIDVLITDPPYGIGKSTWDLQFPVSWIDEAWRVTSRMIVMVGTDKIPEVANQIGRYTGCLVLHARNGMTRTHIGFRNWTPALMFGDWRWRPAPDYLPFNVDPSEQIDHPSPKPLSAMVRLLTYYTDPDDVICDPFAGSGTTLVAARNLGRHYIGCDISAEYVAIAQRRLAAPYTLPMFTEQEAV